jgi:transposase
VRDELGTIYEDEQFAELYASEGQAALSPWRLALVTVLQFAEELTDRQAAEAVRSRIDWKYLLGLPLTDGGFDYSVLSEFRGRLVGGGAIDQLLDRLLEVCRAKGVVKARGQQRTDSTHILAAVRDLGRLELVGMSLQHALNSLAVVVPTWLKATVPASWSERYAPHWENYRLPKTEAERLVLAEQIGRDGRALLSAIYAPSTLSWLRQIPAVQTLRQIWLQNFYQEDGALTWRRAGHLPPAAKALCSPFDTQARYSIKRETEWTGYKVHLTECCDSDAPHLIVHVMTTEATTQDNEIVAELHQKLADKALLPGEHLLDQGYSDSHDLVTAQQQYGIDLVMPLRAGSSWQQRQSTAYDLSHFQIDWQAQQVTCPQGKTSASWSTYHDKQGQPRLEVKFNTADCAPCPARTLCTQSKRPRRKLTFRPQAEYQAITTARAYQQTDAFTARYALRAGIEGTISQAVAFAIRQSRYRGLLKTHLQHVATAIAINLKRLVNWWNHVPFASTKPSRFAALMAT